MKRIIFSGLALALMTSSLAVFAQNSNYADDVYYNASKAENNAQESVEAASDNQQSEDSDANYYNSSTGDTYTDGTSNYNSAYQQNAVDNDQYVDYNDDYASRIQRFYYPVSGIGYWGSVYQPYWMMSGYSNYGWGSGWYRPGFSFSWGWNNPFWANNWGWDSWYGSGYGFNPYYGYGGGYWNGYNNGYYNGLYNNWYNNENNSNSGRYHYGPRGMNHSRSVRGVGNYGVNSRTSPILRSSNVVTPQRASNNVKANQEVGGQRPINRQDNRIRLGNTRIYNNNRVEANNQRVINQNSGRVQNNQVRSQPNRRSFRVNQSSRRTEVKSQRTYAPPVRRSEPERTYTPPARTERSYSPPTRSSTSSSSRSYTPSRSSGSVRSMRR